MAEITLYIPNGGEEKYQVESHRVDDAGVLHFRVEGQDVVTTVPFLVRYAVKPKEVTTTQARPRRTSSGHTAWS